MRAIRDGHASITAQRVAAHRLSFDRVPTELGDPAAEDRLAHDVAGSVAVDLTTPMSRYLAGRTAFFDRVVVGALDRGIAQVVVAAAGYDGRALRYHRPGVRWFEVDHPATQRDKRARLTRLGIACPHIAFVAADFAVDDVAAGLEAAGHDATRPCVFTCEGVAVYLELEVLTALLVGLRAAAAPGSRLAISLSVDRGDVGEGARRAAFRRRVASLGEPARSMLTVDAAGELLAATGWQVLSSAETARARAAGLVVVVPA